MYEEYQREFNEAERAELAESIAIKDSPVTSGETVQWLGAWICGAIVGVLVAAIPLWLDLHMIVAVTIGVIVAIWLIICLLVIINLIESYFNWRRFMKDHEQNQGPEIKAALKHGKVLVKKVEAHAVIELEESEDEGAGFLFDIGDGRILYLKGQRFYPDDENRDWPNSSFEIVRTVYGNRWVGLRCTGQLLKPIELIPLRECREEVIWDDREEVLIADLREFANSLLAHPGCGS